MQEETDTEEEERRRKKKLRLTLCSQNLPILYSAFIEKSLDWPSQSVEWLPWSQDVGAGWAAHSLLLGTQTSAAAGNYLLICRVLLPGDQRAAGAAPREDVCRVVARLAHPAGDVDRARACPQNPALVASKCIGAGITLYDTRQAGQGADREDEEECGGPLHTHALKKCAGFGLCWREGDEGALLTTCEGGRVGHLRVDQGCTIATSAASTSHASCTAPVVDWYSGHSGECNDVACPPVAPGLDSTFG